MTGSFVDVAVCMVSSVNYALVVFVLALRSSLGLTRLTGPVYFRMSGHVDCSGMMKVMTIPSIATQPLLGIPPRIAQFAALIVI